MDGKIKIFRLDNFLYTYSKFEYTKSDCNVEDIIINKLTTINWLLQ